MQAANENGQRIKSNSEQMREKTGINGRLQYASLLTADSPETHLLNVVGIDHSKVNGKVYHLELVLVARSIKVKRMMDNCNCRCDKKD